AIDRETAMTSDTGETPVRGVPAASPARTGRQRVWLLNAVLVVVAVALYVLVNEHLQRLATHKHALPTLVLVLLFALSEIFVVHIKFRHDAHTFSLSEIPLMLGLFFCAPQSLILAQVVGGGAMLIAHRRQSLIKLVFNLGVYAASLAVAAGTFRAVLG